MSPVQEPGELPRYVNNLVSSGVIAMCVSKWVIATKTRKEKHNEKAATLILSLKMKI